MNQNKKAVTVGIFIFLGLLIFVAGVLTLGGQKKTFEKKIHISAIFKDVSGLQEGNNVWFSGVKVGTVKEVNIKGSGQVEVVMSINTKVHEFIRKDAKAKISSEGFIGSKIVVIYGGSTKMPSVSEDDRLAVDDGMNTDEILATFQENNKNLLAITTDFKTISSRIANGEGTVGKLLSDETLANQLQSAMIRLNQASSYAQQLTADIARYTSQLQTEGSLAQDLVTDTIIFNRLRASVTQLNQVTTTAMEVAENINAASVNIRETSANVNSERSPVGVLLNDAEAGENLKATLANLQLGTKKLDENLEALQHNFLLRGFFKKKKKAEEKD